MNIPLIIIALFATMPIVYFIFQVSKNDEKLDSEQKGTITLFAENSCKALTAALVEAFRSQYPGAHFEMCFGNEKEAFQALLNDTSRLVIMPRGLTQAEERIFHARYFMPRTTAFAQNSDGTQTLTLFNNQARVGLGTSFARFVVGPDSNPLIVREGYQPISQQKGKPVGRKAA